MTRRVRGTGRLETAVGIPFVGVVDFARGTLTWGKDNPVAAGDTDEPLAVARLARGCTAARVEVFGAGNLAPPGG